jgi:hypothetical protein
MEIAAHLALFAWIALVPFLFTRMNKRRAVLIAVVAGWLFLPCVELNASWHEVPAPYGTPPLYATKRAVISYGLIVAILLKDLNRLRRFRLQWFDAPMILWCASPLLSTLANDLKITIAIMDTTQQFLAWGVPYLVGRLYFADLEGIRALAIGFLLGAIVYVPFCLVEIRIGTELHQKLWGFHQHDPRQAMRGSLWRPMVFLDHGLAVGMWMGSVTLLAFWMWWTRSLTELQWLKGVKPLPLGVVVGILVVTCVLMGSAGALALGLAGAGALVLSRWVPLPLVLVGLVLVGPLYCVGRLMAAASQPTGYLNSSRSADELGVLDRRMMEKPLFVFSSLTGTDLHDFLEAMFNKDRADSFMTRLIMEDRLMEKGLEQPFFGWGGQGRARVTDPSGNDIIIADGLWIIVFGDRGCYGVAAVILVLLVPTARMVWTYPQRFWSHPALAPAAALAVIMVLVLIDDLSNAMYNMLFVVANGALSGLVGTPLMQPSPEVLEPFPAEEPPPPDDTALSEGDLPGVLRRQLPSPSRRREL